MLGATTLINVHVLDKPTARIVKFVDNSVKSRPAGYIRKPRVARAHAILIGLGHGYLMKRIPLAILAAFLLSNALLGAVAKKPKLVIAIVIDQFRYDYLTRFRADYRGGLDRLLTKGAVLTNARYMHFPTLTAPGHSTLLTGATPSVSGIVANDWFDREEKRKVTSVADYKTKLLGGAVMEGASPRRLLVSTLGDELKLANGGKSRVIGISLKDRAAILPAGHSANGAYWFDLKTGNFVSSDYNMKDLPQWEGLQRSAARRQISRHYLEGPQAAGRSYRNVRKQHHQPF